MDGIECPIHGPDPAGPDYPDGYHAVSLWERLLPDKAGCCGVGFENTKQYSGHQIFSDLPAANAEFDRRELELLGREAP